MTTFSEQPNTATLTTKPRVRIAAFGDGYEQRIADGINSAPRSWALSFTQAAARAEEIHAFFEARSGTESFDWTPPYGAAGKWVARDWSMALIGPIARQVTVTFVEVFGA